MNRKSEIKTLTDLTLSNQQWCTGQQGLGDLRGKDQSGISHTAKNHTLQKENLNTTLQEKKKHIPKSEAMKAQPL
ncbi:hypothetical protein E2C01_029208 [Portunus trituberculatus]|uniref:Uncharacterized protein n=1 Tax=Portunus trituberculatus TaxID=210409 RepID=A0A5B7ES77_PORTR|nr:hypothetical protein [Portunus trituberculatus]